MSEQLGRAGRQVAVPTHRRRSLTTNMIANAGGKLVGLVLALGISPFIIHHLGLATFGFWALVASLTGYAGLLDFGAGNALTKFIAELDALGDQDGIRRRAGAAAIVTRGMGVAVYAASIAFVLGVPKEWGSTWPPGWEWAILGSSTGLVSILNSSVWLAFPRGLGRWDLQALPLLAYQVTFGIGTLIVLPLGAGIAGLGAVTAAAGVAMLAGSRIVCRRVWPHALRGGHAKRGDIKELVHYGGNLQAGALATVFTAQADKPMILLAGGSLAFVGVYELASRVAFQVRTLPITVLGPLTAKVAADVAGGSRDDVRAMYAKTLPVVVALGAGPLLAFYGLCYPLVLAWLGTSYSSTALIVCLLGAAYAVNFVTGAGSAVANGAGRPQLERNYTLVALFANIGLSIVLGFMFGPWGVIAATVVSLVVASMWFLFLVDDWLELETAWTLRRLRDARAGLLAGAAISIAVPSLVAVSGVEQRLVFLALGSAGGAVAVCCWWNFVPQTKAVVRLRRRATAVNQPS